ncbi:MAG: hypothetical protein U1E76_25240 [Planctomycetota bacterium]
MWSIASVVVLAGIGALVWWSAFRNREPLLVPPASDPALGLCLTPSMRAVKKYLVVVALLFLVQVMLGALTRALHGRRSGRSSACRSASGCPTA